MLNANSTLDTGRGGRGHATPAGHGRRFRSGVALVLVAIQLGGCFRYVPVGGAPVPAGTRVSLAINDAGRVALAEEIGPGIRTIHGDLREATDSVIVVSLSSVEYYDLSVPARMAGESREIPRRYVSEFRERQLSRSRTWMTIGLVVAGLVVGSLIAITGFGTDDPSDRPNGGGNGDNQ
jgi:hypothetical protein